MVTKRLLPTFDTSDPNWINATILPKLAPTSGLFLTILPQRKHESL